MKCNQSRPRFELVSPCPFPTAITTTPRVPPHGHLYLTMVLLYRHMQIHTYTCRVHIDAIIKTSEDFFKKIYLSLYLKGLCMWEGVGGQTELQYIDHHSYCHQRCVFLVLQGCSTGDPEAQLSAECLLSLPHLVSNFWSPKLVSKLTDFLSSPSYIIVQSPT